MWNRTCGSSIRFDKVAWDLCCTGASLLLGFVGHALFNVGFGIALAAPLVAIQRDLDTAASRRA